METNGYKTMNKIREWGETVLTWVDGPFSYCDEFLTPIYKASQWHPS